MLPLTNEFRYALLLLHQLSLVCLFLVKLFWTSCRCSSWPKVCGHLNTTLMCICWAKPWAINFKTMGIDKASGLSSTLLARLDGRTRPQRTLHSDTRASVRSDFNMLGPGSQSSQRCSASFRFCEGQPSSSLQQSVNHFLMDPALCREHCFVGKENSKSHFFGYWTESENTFIWRWCSQTLAIYCILGYNVWNMNMVVIHHHII